MLIFSTIGHLVQFSYSGDGTLSNCLIDTALNVSNSKGVDTFELFPAQYDAICNGLIYHDCSEYLVLLIDVIHKGGLTPDSASNNNFIEVFHVVSCIRVFLKKIYCLWDM